MDNDKHTEQINDNTTESNIDNAAEHKDGKGIKNPTVLAALVLLTIVIVIGAVFIVNDKASAPANTTGKNTSANQQQTTGDQTKSNTTTPNSSNSTTPGSTPPTTTAPSSSEITSSIAITSSAFAPASTTVKKGTAVTWTNKDGSNHAIAEDNSIFRSPQLKSGESYTYAFNTAGTYHYKDVINPALTGSITVSQ